MSNKTIPSEVKQPSHFKTWLIISLIVAVIASITAILAFTGQEEDCDCPPAGWKTVRPPEFILALEEQGEYIWAGGLDGLYAIKRSTGEVMPSLVSGAPPITYVNDILVDRNGVLWIGHWGGLVRFENGVWKTLTDSDGMPQGPVRSLMEDSSGALWVGTENGIICFDGTERKYFSAEDGPGFNEIDVIFQDKVQNRLSFPLI